jgi:hypothetical protein
MPDSERKTGFTECDQSLPADTSKGPAGLVDSDGERERKQVCSGKGIHRHLPGAGEPSTLDVLDVSRSFGSSYYL